MSSLQLPTTAQEFMNWDWPEMEPYYTKLIEQPIDYQSSEKWLSDWSDLRKLVDETYARLQLDNALDTFDEGAEQRYHHFIEHVYPHIQSADQKLKEKLLSSGLEHEGMQIPVRNMRIESEIFREANLPLIAEEHKLGTAYNKIFGAQTVEWEGEEITPQQLRPKAHVPERDVRERAWRLVAERQLADREAINENWVKLMDVRGRIAENAGFPNYRDYRWQQLLRVDYTPGDARRFHQAILDVAVPAATRIYERNAQRLGVDHLRPWDVDFDRDPLHLPALHAYDNQEEFESRAEAIFQRVHPRVGDYFTTMRQRRLLDLENRKGKAPGAFCTSFAVQGVPFVFMNAVGLAGDVRTLLHECGHAFHVFERNKLPYQHQWRTTSEFSEVASMSMELLGAPYLVRSQGGYFSDQEAALANTEHMEKIILFWPYMAVVDAFQHWVYENHTAASDPANCDAAWGELWRKFMPGMDWSGLEDAMVTGWHRKLHIHRYPFYYIDYGIAQLGAVQVWRRSLADPSEAVENYLNALALGSTRPLPELFKAAGGRFEFNNPTLQEAVSFLEERLSAYENV